MTERERLLEKIRKVQALANRGADGEKQSAAALLDKLMKQYGIDEAEIAEERLEKCFFRYKTPYERKLLVLFGVPDEERHLPACFQKGRRNPGGGNQPKRST